jgi:hypothetical protein
MIRDLLRIPPPWFVHNMDETSWKLLNSNCPRFADRGAEWSSRLFDGDPKAYSTVIVMINVVGEKLLLWVTVKEKTNVARGGFATIARRK